MRCQIFVSVLLLLAASGSRAEENQPASKDEFGSVVVVSERIEAAIAAGELHRQTKNFGWANPGCKLQGYPILERSLVLDTEGQIRLYDRSQIVSHGAIERIRSFFDERGRLRIVERKLGNTIDLVRVSESGKILLSRVSHDRGETWHQYSADFDDWYMNPRTPSEVEAEFAESEPTCEQGAG